MDIIDLLKEISDSASKNLLNNLHFIQHNLCAQSLATKTWSNYLQAKIEHKELNWTADYIKEVEDYRDASKNISAEEVVNVLNHTIFISSYQIFELGISKVITQLLQFFPGIFEKCYGQISIDAKLFRTSESVDELKGIAIARIMKDHMQAGNISNILSKDFQKIFGLNLMLKSTDLQELYLISRLRNIAVHNNSHVNHIILSELKRAGIAHSFKEGESIHNFLQEKAGDYVIYLEELFGKIIAQICNEIKQIRQYDIALQE